MLGGREAALLYLLGVLARGRADLVAEAAIALDEFRGELGEEAEHAHRMMDWAHTRSAPPKFLKSPRP
jgi:hypothetical protein